MKVVCPYCLSTNNVPKKDSYKKANCGKCKNTLLDGKVIELDDNSFDDVIVNSDIPVIVDFWAAWCGPCKMMAPVFSSVATQFPLKATFAKVNTDQGQNVSSRYGIRSIPTLIIFKNGVEVDRVSGALDQANLAQFIRQYID